MDNHDRAISILEHSSDGDRLSRADLLLVQCAVNGTLSQQGIQEFEQLERAVNGGSYFNAIVSAPPALHGVEHLTQDADGYVYWRGRQVEHFASDELPDEAAAAQNLAATCLRLEERGFAVCCRTLLRDACSYADPQTPWRIPLQYSYAFFECKGAVLGVFDRADGTGDLFLILQEGGQLVVKNFDSGYNAFQALYAMGATAMSCQPDYPETIRRLEGLGLTPDIVNAEIMRSITTASQETPHATNPNYH